MQKPRSTGVVSLGDHNAAGHGDAAVLVLEIGEMRLLASKSDKIGLLLRKHVVLLVEQ